MNYKYELPTHLQTKSMGSARLRNRLEQKTLVGKLDDLTCRYRCRSSKIMTEIGDLQDMVKEMNPGVGNVIVCPKGFSDQEKATYKRLRRRRSTSSMSLTQFDRKMSDFRYEIQTYRRSSLTSHRAINLKEETLFVEPGIVDLKSHEFCAPLNKHKHTMREAFIRATTKDVGADNFALQQSVGESSIGGQTPTQRVKSGRKSRTESEIIPPASDDSENVDEIHGGKDDRSGSTLTNGSTANTSSNFSSYRSVKFSRSLSTPSTETSQNTSTVPQNPKEANVNAVAISEKKTKPRIRLFSDSTMVSYQSSRPQTSDKYGDVTEDIVSKRASVLRRPELARIRASSGRRGNEDPVVTSEVTYSRSRFYSPSGRTSQTNGGRMPRQKQKEIVICPDFIAANKSWREKLAGTKTTDFNA